MIIGHFKATPLAYSPEMICDVINKYTEHKAYVFGNRLSSKTLQPDTDIVHQHNRNYTEFNTKLIQYHSEPSLVDLNVTIPKLVLAQYHATLKEYNDCIIVRNPIDIFDEQYKPRYNNKKIRIGFSPSHIVPRSEWADKGYLETIMALEVVKNKYKGLVDIDIITDVPLQECLTRKSLCNIFIDEVKTASYHRSGLESLAMGKLTICSLSSEVESVMLKASGADAQPFVNVYYPELAATLISIIENGLDYILLQGEKSRLWVEAFWQPSVIANEYITIYNNIRGK
jgi:hypothetical protein